VNGCKRKTEVYLVEKKEKPYLIASKEKTSSSRAGKKKKAL